MSSFPGEERRVELYVWGQSDVGRARRENQDAFLVLEVPEGPGAEGFLLGPDSPGLTNGGEARVDVGPRGVLLLVADGMGGAAGGAVASRLGASVIAETFGARWLGERIRTPAAFAQRMREAVEEANRRIHRRAAERPELHGMGTTATVAGILDGIVYVAQVGDSRAYLLRGGRTLQMTRDQSVVQQLVEQGAMSPEEAERSVHRNVLLQALGTEPEVRVDLTFHELRRGDRLLLCSDGLTGLVGDGEIAAVVERASTPAAACDELVALANDRGGPDNITVVLGRVEGEGLPAPGPGDVLARRAFEPGAE
jgi:PPM family protein phosphatase